MNNSDRIILDLFGGTGAWSKNYAEAGYDVRIITLPKEDVLTYLFPSKVYGILMALPCDDFSVSGAQYWAQKDKDGRTIHSLRLLIAGLKIIAFTQPVFWVIENPVGRLRRFLGEPKLIFNPCDYGDPYTKKTLLWGDFNIPDKNPIKPIRVCNQGSWVQRLGGKSEKTKRLRSITPPLLCQSIF